MLAWGWRRALIAFAAGAVTTLALPPFNLWPVPFLTFPVLVWLIDGAAAGRLRRRGRRPPSRAGGSASAISSPASIGSATRSWSTPRHSAGCCRSRSSRLPAGLALFTGVRIRARAADLDARRDARAGARGRAHRRRMAARPPAHRLSLEHLRLRADDAAGAGAERVADRHLGPDVPRGRGLCRAGGAGRRSRPTRGGRWLAPALGVVVLAALAAYGAGGCAPTPTTFVDGVRLRIMQPNLQQDEQVQLRQKQAVMGRYLALSDRASGPQATGLRDVTHLIWPESAFPFFLTREADALAQIAELLPEGTVLITGAVRAPETVPTDSDHARLQFDLRDRPRRLDPVDLRQGASGSVRRISAVPGFPRTARPACSSPRCSGGFIPGDRRRAIDRAARAAASCRWSATRSSFPGEAVPRGERPGWMLNLTNDGWFGISPGPTSTSSRRACAPSRKDCRWCAPPIPGFRRWSIRSAASSNRCRSAPKACSMRRLPRPLAPTLYARSGDGPAGLMVARRVRPGRCAGARRAGAVTCWTSSRLHDNQCHKRSTD